MFHFKSYGTTALMIWCFPYGFTQFGIILSLHYACVLSWALLLHCQFCLSLVPGSSSWFPISPLQTQHRLSNKNWQVRLITTSCKVFATFPTVCRLSLTQSTSKLRRLANLFCFNFSKRFSKSQSVCLFRPFGLFVYLTTYALAGCINSLCSPFTWQKACHARQGSLI